ncbi:MAG: Fe-S cluster assembly protein SufD [Chloroflexi bacterium]|nr:Fe-S cluster assembly protein SufD [Chloroflexota bacterium]
MLQVAREKEQFLSAYEALQRNVLPPEPAWLRETRQRALTRFEDLHFPTTRDEDWKYTSVAPIVETPFQPILDGAPDLPEADAARLTRVRALAPDARGWTQLVIVDGRVAPNLSSLPVRRDGLVVAGLSEAVQTQEAAVESHLARYARYETNAFTAINTALIRDGAVVYVPDGYIVEEPIHVVFIATSREAPTVVHPRTLVITGTGSQAVVIETYVSAQDAHVFSNAVTELVLGDGSVLSHYRLMLEGPSAYHVATTQVHQACDSAYTSYSIAMGARLARNDLNVLLDGEGADCTLNGLYVATGTQHVDHHTSIDHAVPHGTSRQLYKGVLDGRGRAVFNGMIRVRPGAQKSDAHQINRNLLLSEQAIVDTKPQLEILADDVRCTHGAAIGQLDDDMLFYARSRGMGEQTARGLLTYGFAAELIERIAIQTLRERLAQLLMSALRTGWEAKVRP